jgi:thiamine biosynthesis lipoprotein
MADSLTDGWPRQRWVEHAMGTVFSIDLRDPGVSHDVLAEVVAWLHEVDATFSTYRPDSAISRMARGELRLADCPPEVAEVLDLCARAERDTDGYFCARWNGGLDPTGLVKGWSVERAHAMLVAAGSRAHAINGGGDVRTNGQPAPGEPWRIGVAHPLTPGVCVTVVTGPDLAVATSGNAERGEHILDPFTGRPADALAGLTVVGPDLALADAYATGGVAMGRHAVDLIAGIDGYEAFAVTRHGRLCWTPGYPEVGAIPPLTAVG